MFGPFGILHIGAPQASNYELSPVKWDMPGGTAPLDPGDSNQ